jgi:hypothetical protein
MQSRSAARVSPQVPSAIPKEESTMNAKKATETSDPQMPLGGRNERKPWVKKTPVQAVLNQIERLHEGLAKKEEELKQAKRQLQKLEEVRKILESA